MRTCSFQRHEAFAGNGPYPEESASDGDHASYFYGSPMTRQIQAVYENRVFKPLEPIQVEEHAIVSLVVSCGQEPADTAEVDRQRPLIEAMLKEAADIPPNGPSDYVSRRDHDRVLHGRCP